MKLNNLFTKVVAVLISLGMLTPSPLYGARQLSTVESPATLKDLTQALKMSGMITRDQAGAIIGEYMTSQAAPDTKVKEAFTVLPDAMSMLQTALARAEVRAESQKAISDRITDQTPRHMFVKDAPTLGWKVTSENIQDIPEAIRRHLGGMDQTQYGTMKPFIGSIINLQMKDATTPDFYAIGLDSFTAKYSASTVPEVGAKNKKYLGRVSSVPGLSELIASGNPNLVAVLRTTPQAMVRMSEIGYPVEEEVVISVDWGAGPETQKKRAGVDAYLAHDGKQWYMVNLDDRGLPASYVPAVRAEVRAESQKAISDRITDQTPRHMFVKDAPTLGWKVTSENIQDIPEAIRSHLGGMDQTQYGTMKPFVGSIINLQMKDATTPDFYPIGLSSFTAKYSASTITEVGSKNAKYMKRVSSVPGLSELIASGNPNLVAVLRTTTQAMVRMSEIGYPIAEEVVISVDWGAGPETQTKPAGKDAYLVHDGKQSYMVNLDDRGLPASYVPAARAEVRTRQQAAKVIADYVVGRHVTEQDLMAALAAIPNAGERIHNAIFGTDETSPVEMDQLQPAIHEQLRAMAEQGLIEHNSLFDLVFVRNAAAPQKVGQMAFTTLGQTAAFILDVLPRAGITLSPDQVYEISFTTGAKAVPTLQIQSLVRSETREEVEVPSAIVEMEQKTGTNGWRAQVDAAGNVLQGKFNLFTVGRMAQAWANHLKGRLSPNEPVMVGFDNRPNGDVFGLLFARVLKANGIPVVFSNKPTTSPAMIRMTDLGGRFRYGFLITASHNPPTDNGIKFYKEGTVMPDPESIPVTYGIKGMKAFAKALLSVVFDMAQGEFEEVDSLGVTEAHYRKSFPEIATMVEGYQKRTGVQLIVDQLHGSSAGVAPYLQSLGLEVIQDRTRPMSEMWQMEVFRNRRYNESGKPNPVPFRPEPKEVFLHERFQEFKKSAPAGSLYFGIDGDADRLAVWIKKADGNIQEVAPNDLGILYGYRLVLDLLETIDANDETIYFVDKTQPTTAGLDFLVAWANQQAKARGKKVSFQLRVTPVGSKHFEPEYKKGVLLLGVEESGHIVMPKFFDDAVGQLHFLLQGIAASGQSLQDTIYQVKDEIGRAVGQNLNAWVYRRVNPDVNAAFAETFRGPMAGVKYNPQDLKGAPLQKNLPVTPEIVFERLKKALGERSTNIAMVRMTTENPDYSTGDVTLEQYLALKAQGKAPKIKPDEGMIVTFKDNSWLQIRVSGTEGVVRVYGEAPSEADVLAFQQAAVDAYGIEITIAKRSETRTTAAEDWSDTETDAIGITTENVSVTAAEPAGTKVVSIDFAKVIGQAALVPQNAIQVRTAVTSSAQEPVIFDAAFAFDAEMAGLPMIPALAAGNPAVVIARNRSEARMVEDFNAQLPSGVPKILVANTPEEAVSLLRQAMAERVRRGIAKAGTRIRAIVAPSSADIALLKKQIGEQGIFIATKGWLMKTADRAGLTAVLQRFAEMLAVSKSA